MNTLWKELPIWKTQLLAECEQAIRELPTPGLIELPSANDDQPSLYDFYAELAVVRNEQRTGNRKLSEVLTDFSNVLTDIKERQSDLQARAAEPAPPVDSKADSKIAKALIDILDRVDRIIAASEEPIEFARPSGIFGFLQATPVSQPNQWIKQRESLGILRKHFSPLMELVELEYRPVEGLPFDPQTMKAVSCPADGELSDFVVTKEVLKGYWWRNENIRPAEVEVG